MAPRKTNTEAAQAMVPTKVEGSNATITVPEAVAPAAEENSAAPIWIGESASVPSADVLPEGPIVTVPLTQTTYIDVVEVIGPDAGRWRITANPRRFGPEPTVIPLDDLTEADLAELKDDTELRVQTMTVPKGI